MPQVLRKKMQSPGELVVKGCTYPWTLSPRLSITVKCAVIQAGKASVVWWTMVTESLNIQSWKGYVRITDSKSYRDPYRDQIV